MSLADDLEQAAHSLRQAATKYTTLSASFQKQARGLSGLVEGSSTAPTAGPTSPATLSRPPGAAPQKTAAVSSSLWSPPPAI